MPDPSVVIRFKDLHNDPTVREHLEKRCARLASRVNDLTRLELTLTPNAGEFAASGQAAARGISVAAHAAAEDIHLVGERVLDKLERELRREHDKRIYGRRRTAQKARRIR
ncbi:MAG: HPF/RaiA family ribosome-associated protein [Proteobacteria bacterium]|nr:HPF/RaiA family ribosome-associated protein [Pseudomonadota bacterium]